MTPKSGRSTPLQSVAMPFGARSDLVSRRSLLLGLGAVPLAMPLAGCAPGPDYVPPGFGFLSRYGHSPDVPPVLLRNTAWWQGLDDPVLNQLLALALAGNLTLSSARERVTEAQALRQSVPGAAVLSPSAQARVSGSDTSGPDLQSTVQLGLGWMLDPYGARRQELRAADARIDMSAAEVDAARLLVLYNMANAYTALRYSQRIAALAQAELDSRLQTLALTRRLADAESATRLDIIRSEARVADIRAGLPDQQGAISIKLNEIAVLAGMTPGTLPAGLMQALGSGNIPRPRLSPQVGIPADLLRNRPDIRIAERRYYAAVAQIGVAEAALYPSLSLTGTISLDALNGGGRAAQYFFGPVVQFPALPLRGRATVAARRAAARQEHEAWKSTVLSAILEVENALVDYQAVAAAMQSTAQADRLYREALDLTRTVFEQGEATLGDLIDAQEAVAGADRALAGMTLRHAQSFIALNVRLGAGGGAEAGQATDTPPQAGQASDLPPQAGP